MFQQAATWARDAVPLLGGLSDGAVWAALSGAAALVVLGVWDTLRRW